MSKKNVVKGTLIAGLVGMVAGLLLAPKSGKETREDIRGKLKDGTADVRQRLDLLGDQVTEQLDMVKDLGKDLKADAKLESQDLIVRAEAFKANLRDAVKDLSKSTKKTQTKAAKHAAELADEGAALAKELERVTKAVAGNAKTEVKRRVKKA